MPNRCIFTEYDSMKRRARTLINSKQQILLTAVYENTKFSSRNRITALSYHVNLEFQVIKVSLILIKQVLE